MKRLLLAGVMCVVSAQAAHHMQSEEAKSMEEDYKREQEKNPARWEEHWEFIKREAQWLASKSVDKAEKERYETIVRCARFLEYHHNYFIYRDRVNQITQGIPESELATVSAKGLDHPLCHKIAQEPDQQIREQLIRDAKYVLAERRLPATWAYWGYGWLPQQGYYDAQQHFIADQELVSGDTYPEKDMMPEPDVAKKARAILACQKCTERDDSVYKMKKEFDERFLSKKNS